MPSRASGRGRTLRRAGTLAAALLCGAAASASAAQADAPTVTVTGDSVLVTGQSAGSTTLQATRPDAITQKPVVIGQYKGNASAFGPFSVNTTVPTALQPDGDCWQAGALASALTPDLQPGDTVTVTQTPLFGQPASTSVAVTAAALKGAVGPIPGCADIAPLAHNAATHWTDAVTGSPITVSGVAQPFATSVSVSATDGSVSTAPVVVAPAQDGSWSATIAARQVDRLANGALSLAPVFEVPDVSTGATAHIAAGAAVKLSKSSAASSPGSGAPSKPGAPPSTAPASGRRAVVRVPARVRLGVARRKGIRVVLIAPKGAHVLRVRLERGGKTVLKRDVKAATAGSRQVVRLRVQHRGSYHLTVRAGTSATALGAPVSRKVRVH